jgi:hypothetical protein
VAVTSLGEINISFSSLLMSGTSGILLLLLLLLLLIPTIMITFKAVAANIDQPRPILEVRPFSGQVDTKGLFP